MLKDGVSIEKINAIAEYPYEKIADIQRNLDKSG